MKFFFLLVWLSVHQDSSAQNVILETQAEVDAFDPTTTIITGNLRIGLTSFNETSDITSLDNLSSLIEVNGNIDIRSNHNLLNLDGLNNVTTVEGYLNIISNDKLENLDGFVSLQSIGGFMWIQSNESLKHFNGFINLTTIGGYLKINFNYALENINGLNKLTSVGRYLEISDNVLPNIDGLSNLSSVGEHITIFRNYHLKNLDGLSGLSSEIESLSIFKNVNLTNVNGLSGLNSSLRNLDIYENNNLINLDGLENIYALEWGLSIYRNNNLLNIDGLSGITSIAQYVRISQNPKLINIDGLSAISSIGQTVSIDNNPTLENVDGLSNVTFIAEDLRISNNSNLEDCCGIQELIKNKDTAIGGTASIYGNPAGCSSELDVLSSCSMGLTLSITPPCIGAENGTIQVFVDHYDTIPFSYEWNRIEDGLTGNGISQLDNFNIDMLGFGTYNITVTNPRPDTVVKLDILILPTDGEIFEIVEVKTTNSSIGLNNGSITVTTAGGQGPYNFTWSGAGSGSESEVANNFYTIPSLDYGEYIVTVEDNNGASKVIEISLLDEQVAVVACEKPLDIVILNDVSGSVDAVEYSESKQFFISFLQEVNIGIAEDDSRAAIAEWSSLDEQKIQIPLTNDIAILESYIDQPRAFDEGTAPHEALKFGEFYLDTNARPNAEKVIILSTDGTESQLSSSLVALADDLKAKGFHIITIAFDGAFVNAFTKDILRKVASIDALAPGAAAYSLLDSDLAKKIVFNYLCPINPGSSSTAYFNRDGAIDIVEVSPIGNCPHPDYVEVTIDISAYRELSISAGTPITFYHNNPNHSGATPILTWQIPCAIPVDSIETYTISLPIEGPSNIYAVLNDDGEQGPPIIFPITETEEVAYSNNIDNERICLEDQATIQALKYAVLPIPACDTVVNYTINVCNISEVDAFDITVEDIPPSGFVQTGSTFNDNGCAIDLGGTYDLPADCCFSLFVTYDAGEAEFGYFGDQGVNLSGPENQTYFGFDGSTTTDEDVTLDGSIDCPSPIITFTKAVNIDESCDDGFVEFTFTINNEMNIPLQGLIFRDVLPDPCTWAYNPYGENGLSIANSEITGNEAIFTIDKVEANTNATFYMDASLNSWSSDGTLSNTASLENVTDVMSGGNITLTSNTTDTQITASPKISLPDTIIVNASSSTIRLEAILSMTADIAWTTEGDGQFTNENQENTTYKVGTQDSLDGEVRLFISAISDCAETGESVLIQFVECNLEVEIIEIGDCDDMGTPEDVSDDTYEVTFIGSSDDTSEGSKYLYSSGSYFDTLAYFTEHTMTLSADGLSDTLIFSNIDNNSCYIEKVVNQNSCYKEIAIFIPNIITPNSDNTNDEWAVTIIGESIKIQECSIYDRWGNRVYFSTGNTPSWNGRYNQSLLSEGVYIYVLTYTDNLQAKKQKVGNITLLH